MIPVQSPTRVLERHGLKPKRSWSQSFLADGTIASRIAAAAARDAAGGPVLELGAGTGALTRELAARCTRVVALERDRDMAAILRREFSGASNVEVVEDNALTVDIKAVINRPRTAAGGRPAISRGLESGPLPPKPVVVGNLPYHIASQIVFHLLEERAAVSSFILMLQREMAVRICAAPGTRECGVISILCALHSRPEILFSVPAGAFHPRPRVDSAVVRFAVRASPAVAVDEARFARVVRAAFSQRRKTVRNALKPVSPDTAALDRALARAGVDPGRRGETLSIEEFARVTGELEAHR